MPETVKLDTLTPDEHNANVGTERGRYMLDHSLRQYGAGRSILIDKHGRVIAGNKTLEAAADIGLEDVEIIHTTGDKLIAVQRDDLDLETDPEARELAYADNRTSEVGFQLDAAQFKLDLDAGLDLSWGWLDGELLELGIGDDPPDDPGAQMDKAAELQEKWQVKRGQVWQVGRHRVMCGDSTSAEDVGRLMGGERATAVVTDPPYGIEREGITNDDPEGLRDLFDGCLAAMPIDDAVVIAFQSPRLFPVWLDAVRDAGHQFERALWMYDENDQTFPWHDWLMCSQAIMASTTGKPKWGRAKPHHDAYVIGLGREWRSGGEDNEFAHASVKPTGVIQDLMMHTTGNVYEPFVGSGTTLVACEQTGRIGYGMEIEPKYVAVTLERLTGMGLEARVCE